MLDLAEQAVAGGLGVLWLGDGFLASADFPGWAGGMESLTELAWLAGRFPSAALGVTAAVLPNRSMLELARQANTLAAVTEGRFTLAVSPGFWDRELEYLALDPADRGALFRSRLAELLSLLADPSISPGPGSFGPPPVWLAGGRPTLRHALRLGLPFQASRLAPDDLAALAAEWSAGGGGLLAHRVYVEAGSQPFAGHEVDRRAVAGTPEAIIDQFRAFSALGVGDLSIVPGHDDASARETVAVLVREVLPALAS